MNTAYAYLYDDFLADRQYADFLAEFETRLAAMGMNGQVARLSMFRNAKEVVEGFIQQGAKTIVAVGDERTLDKLMWFLPDLDAVLGYVSVSTADKTSKLLGLPNGIKATEALGARLIENLDMGRAGDRYFLTEVILENTSASLKVENGFSLSLIHGGKIIVRNLGTLADARDGFLEAEFEPFIPNNGFKGRLLEHFAANHAVSTKILFRSAELISKQPMQLSIDSFTQSGFNLPVYAVPGKLRVIVGKLGR